MPEHTAICDGFCLVQWLILTSVGICRLKTDNFSNIFGNWKAEMDWPENEFLQWPYFWDYVIDFDIPFGNHALVLKSYLFDNNTVKNTQMVITPWNFRSPCTCSIILWWSHLFLLNLNSFNQIKMFLLKNCFQFKERIQTFF